MAHAILTEESRDPLLDDLAGEPTTYEQIDPLPEKEASPLEIPAAPPKPRTRAEKAKAADAKYAKGVVGAGAGAVGNGYAVTVRGEYYVFSADVKGKKVLRPYEVVVNVPRIEGALSTIKNKILDKVLKTKHPEYLGFRTHYIVDVKPLGSAPAPTDVSYMSREQLETVIAGKKIPIDPGMYSDVVELRSAVIDFLQNPNGFAEREERRKLDLAERAELERMNPGLSSAG